MLCSTHWSTEHTLFHFCCNLSEVYPQTAWTISTVMGPVRQNPIKGTVKSVLWLCIMSVHNTVQNSADNLPSYLQTIIIAQMLSIVGKGGMQGVSPLSTELYTFTLHVGQRSLTFIPIPVIVPPVPAPLTSMSILPVHNETNEFFFLQYCITCTAFFRHYTVSRLSLIHIWRCRRRG